MDQKDVNQLVKTIIETQIVQALNNAPEAIEALIKAAMSEPVDKNGNKEGSREFSFGSTKMPYLDWMVGQQIRNATHNAVVKVINEMLPDIESKVREKLSHDDVAKSFVEAVVKNVGQEWRIRVNFEAGRD